MSRPVLRPGGAVEITQADRGQWALRVNGGKPKVCPTLQQAIEQAGNVTFAPGESPGSWAVHIDY